MKGRMISSDCFGGDPNLQDSKMTIGVGNLAEGPCYIRKTGCLSSAAGRVNSRVTLRLRVIDSRKVRVWPPRVSKEAEGSDS